VSLNYLTEIDNQLEELQTELLKLANSKADYEDVYREFKSGLMVDVEA
jgi:hypothetical protein